MACLKCVFFIILAISYGNSYAEQVQEGGAAGSDASDYALGNSELAGVAIVTAVTGLLLLTISGGDEGNNNTTTATVPFDKR
ncbi:exopolysaccharide production protein YjbE [Kosakonia sp. S42]|mgnify:CR=1 FL=1|uniref:exopolysaccharide production protein YjbE n=1 Tax=Kosakonia sp. S42 TaxID=2767458 RepID=UPI00190D193C|nr:exopolysaccharide production protein YjbE [Kosakonia sp. S42]MBK0018999.1 hypothetical protein [Kosakonia sp. S42]